MSAKQKIVHGRGLSNLNLGLFVFSFDVCRASKPVSSINYEQGQRRRLLRAYSKSFGMGSVYQISRKKIGMNGVDVWRETSKYSSLDPRVVHISSNWSFRVVVSTRTAKEYNI